MVPHFPGANPRQPGSIKRDDSTGTAACRTAITHRTAAAGRRWSPLAALSCPVRRSPGGGPVAQRTPPDPAARSNSSTADRASRTPTSTRRPTSSPSRAALQPGRGEVPGRPGPVAAAQGRLAAAKAADVVAASKLAGRRGALRTALSDVDAGEQLIRSSRPWPAARPLGVPAAERPGRAVDRAARRAPADIATGMQVQRNVFGIQGNAITKPEQRAGRSSRASAPRSPRRSRPPRPRGPRPPDGPAGHRARPQQVAADKAEAARLARSSWSRSRPPRRRRTASWRSTTRCCASGPGSQQILIAGASAEKAAAARRKAAAEKAERAKARKEHRPPRRVPDDSGSCRRG